MVSAAPLTVRAACRRGQPLGGADAQALEGALTLTERERDQARAEARVLAHAYQHDSRPPADVVARALAYPVVVAGSARGCPVSGG